MSDPTRREPTYEETTAWLRSLSGWEMARFMISFFAYGWLYSLMTVLTDEWARIHIRETR